MKKILLTFLLIFTNFFLAKSYTIETFELFSPQLGYKKKIWVCKPSDYYTKLKKYKVLYLHDVKNFFNTKTSLDGNLKVGKILDLLTKDIIIVGIEQENENRIDELTPFKNEKYGGGKGKEYLEFVINTTIPFIESKYRIKNGAKNTASGGSSFGGLLSFYATYKYPDIFGKALVFSPAFWINPEIKSEFIQTKKYDARIYFLSEDGEDETMVPLMKEINSLVNTKRCECKKDNKMVIAKKEKHNVDLWHKSFAEAIKWLF